LRPLLRVQAVYPITVVDRPSHSFTRSDRLCLWQVAV